MSAYEPWEFRALEDALQIVSKQLQNYSNCCAEKDDALSSGDPNKINAANEKLATYTDSFTNYFSRLATDIWKEIRRNDPSWLSRRITAIEDERHWSEFNLQGIPAEIHYTIGYDEGIQILRKCRDELHKCGFANNFYTMQVETLFDNIPRWLDVSILLRLGEADFLVDVFENKYKDRDRLMANKINNSPQILESDFPSEWPYPSAILYEHLSKCCERYKYISDMKKVFSATSFKDQMPNLKDTDLLDKALNHFRSSNISQWCLAECVSGENDGSFAVADFQFGDFYNFHKEPNCHDINSVARQVFREFILNNRAHSFMNHIEHTLWDKGVDSAKDLFSRANKLGENLDAFNNEYSQKDLQEQFNNEVEDYLIIKEKQNNKSKSDDIFDLLDI